MGGKKKWGKKTWSFLSHFVFWKESLFDIKGKIGDQGRRQLELEAFGIGRSKNHQVAKKDSVGQDCPLLSSF